MTTKEMIIGFVLSISIPGFIVFILWLNSYLLDRETKQILAGKKLPWGHRKK